jgi:hypothetical protein
LEGVIWEGGKWGSFFPFEARQGQPSTPSSERNTKALIHNFPYQFVNKHQQTSTFYSRLWQALPSSLIGSTAAAITTKTLIHNSVGSSPTKVNILLTALASITIFTDFVPASGSNS